MASCPPRFKLESWFAQPTGICGALQRLLTWVSAGGSHGPQCTGGMVAQAAASYHGESVSEDSLQALQVVCAAPANFSAGTASYENRRWLVLLDMRTGKLLLRTGFVEAPSMMTLFYSSQNSGV
ncbi:hypothetical protein P7K49_029939 [Saguinus oedipus]|uniref:Uncharacterized protein n=1 Tax=Saguinus oedipus TaxID=9490 RepID=A0ABQ9U8M7_SAGOE|nr:hypothetical protein P7K49_029939 [Saguinus oedipus]